MTLHRDLNVTRIQNLDAGPETLGVVMSVSDRQANRLMAEQFFLVVAIERHSGQAF